MIQILLHVTFQIQLMIFWKTAHGVMFLHRHRKYGGAPHVWQRGAEEEMAGAAAQRRDPLLLLYDRYVHDPPT